MIKVQINGFADAAAALESLEKELRVKAVRSGLRMAARPIAEKMRELAPRDTGRLARAVNVLQFTRRGGERLRGTLAGVRIAEGEVAMIIGPNKKIGGKQRAQLAHLLEFGTKPHSIKPEKRILSFARNEAATGTIRHPGIKPKPFMSAALSTPQAEIERLFFQGLERHLNRESARRAK